MKRMTNLADFKAHLAKGHTQFCIALAGGIALSRKDIHPLPDGRLDIFHGIDGHVAQYTEKELLTETNIGKALKRGAFFCEE